MNDRPRGLGRGLSALLGEPQGGSFGGGMFGGRAEEPAATPPATPVAAAPASATAFAPVTVGVPRPAEPPVSTPLKVDPVTSEPTPTAGASVTPFPIQPAPAQIAAEPPVVAPATDFSAPTPEPLKIAIDLIQRNPNQPRRHFDETELAELANSIRAHGVLQPIVLRPAPGSPGRYEIVAGERRWRASQKAGLHVIPAVVMELNDVQILEIAIIENVQRADLNPIEESMGYQALVDRFGRTQQDIAEIVGKSRPHIANMLRLLSLPEEIQDMVRDGRLSAGHARAILTAPNPLELARMAIAQALNVREVERLAAKAKEEKDGPRVRPAPPEKDADTRALETQMSNALGLSVSIGHRGEAGGQVTISYRSLEQLDEICRRLSG